MRDPKVKAHARLRYGLASQRRTGVVGTPNDFHARVAPAVEDTLTALAIA
jgi:hypothetical protein